MDRATYNKCVSEALSGKKFTPQERRREFCIAAKQCSGKASSRGEASQMCELAASQPKPHKSRRHHAPRTGGETGSVSLVLLTTTSCKPCSDAKSYLSEKIDAGIVQVADIQKDDWAADLAAKHKIISVPKLLVIDNQGNPFSEIQITDREQMV